MLACSALLVFTSVTVASAAVAPPGDDFERTPPRLGYINGEVSFWRPGAEDWAPAQINTPLAPGDTLYGGDTATFEVQIGARAFVRGGAGTQIALENQEPDYIQLNVTEGHAALDLRTVPSGYTVELDTPNGAFRVEAPGYYRVDVTGDTTAFIARRGGTASVIAAGGDATTIAANQQLVIEGTYDARIASYEAPDLDDWDRWNYDRTEGLVASASARYVPPDVYGVEELDRYGSWRTTAQYGALWVPSSVGPDWSPYSDGRWVWDPYYGWSWVDYQPWGWAPGHYGRWVYTSGYWGWAPGPIVAAPVYSPALVAFFGGHDFGVSIGIGAPAVGWVALGWGEPIIPWWGGHHHHHDHASWRGWGGPRVVNNVVIKNKTVINVTNINHYRNMDVRNAVIASRQDRFGRGRTEHVRVRQVNSRNVELVRGRVPVQPVAASLSPREGRGRRPPEGVLKRSVVATRAPRDTTARLRAEGLSTATRDRPEPRIVSKVRERSPSEVSRGTAGRVDRLDRAGRPVPPQNEPRGRAERERPDRQREQAERERPDRQREQAERERPDRQQREQAERAAEPRPPRPGERATDLGSGSVAPEDRRRQRARTADEQAPRGTNPAARAPERQERQGNRVARPEPPLVPQSRQEEPQAGDSPSPYERRPQRERAQDVPGQSRQMAPRSQPARPEAARPEPPRHEAARPEPQGRAIRPEPAPRQARPQRERAREMPDQSRREAPRAAPQPERARIPQAERPQASAPQPMRRERVRQPSSRAGDAPSPYERRPQRAERVPAPSQSRAVERQSVPQAVPRRSDGAPHGQARYGNRGGNNN